MPQKKASRRGAARSAAPLLFSLIFALIKKIINRPLGKFFIKRTFIFLKVVWAIRPHKNVQKFLKKIFIFKGGL